MEGVTTIINPSFLQWPHHLTSTVFLPPNPSPSLCIFSRDRWHPSLTELPPADYDTDKPVKHDSRTPGDSLVHEAKVFEILKRHPHPNICVYHGCVRDGDHITAICLKNYRT
ncbi:uncharacterized protein BJ212DRAFT_47801 [Suillus subaureus]|uniref:Uncharacterized protein n=1 Tax=Suillus subaureus TaxID=48587 RepID=A0A9P7EPC4_9AGAM|nr:uncharacterized protein BJ212DRAFT_47801 [Suillus subaureus]KAG1827358.1 hypothetical protein BJ212DRAFT_47801 [Suillus subaureus]